MDIDPVTEAARFAGRSIGPYEVEGLVGAGGMGEVYRAHDTRLDRTVAIKVLPRTLSTDEHARRRFVRETRVASRIVHPYVATVFDVVEDGPDLLLVMEYLEGRTLRQVLRDDRPDRSRVLEIATEITEALEAIHEAGIVHRDLKPGNVMIAPTGHVKVMDFGVARLVESSVAAEDHTLTRDGFQVGTVLYMSPEQVRGRKVDARSDLFALGGLLWEAITGEHPFLRNTVVATATAITTEPPGGGTEPPSLAESGALRDVVLRLLRKDADERYTSASELLEDLRAVARGERPLRTEGIARLQRRRKTMVVATAFAAGAIATALIVAAVLTSPWRGDGAPPGGVVADARPLVVILPFESPDGHRDSRAFMTADLLAAILGDGTVVRTAPMWRVEELLEPLGESASRSSRFEQIRDSMAPKFILAGTVYAEAGSWLASIDVVEGASLGSLAPMQVSAERVGELAARIASRIPRAIGVTTDDASSAALSGYRLLPDDDRALEAFTRAKQHDRRLEWLEARTALEKALEIEPDYLDARLLLASVLGKMGYEREALKSVRDADRVARNAGLQGDAVQALELKAVRGRLTSPDAAAEADSALVARYPDDPELRLTLARSLRRTGDLEGALDQAGEGIRLDAADGRIWLERAEILRRLDRHAESVEARDRAERIFRDDELTVGLAELFEWDALVAWFDGRLEDAAELYARAAQAFESANMPARAAGARQFRGDAFLMLRRNDEARAVYQIASSTLDEAGHYRRAARIQNSAAALLLQEGQLDAAIDEFVQALDRARMLGVAELELDPLTNLAYIRSQTGRAEEAIGLAEDAVEIARELSLESHRCAAQKLLGIAYGEADELRRSTAELDAVATDDGCPEVDRVDAYSWRAWFQWRAERPGDALESSRRAIELAGASYSEARKATLYVDQARILASLGAFDEASTRLTDASDLGGADALARREVAGTIDAVRLRIARLSGLTSAAPDTNALVGERFGQPFWNRLELAAWLLDRGDPAAAIEHASGFVNDPWATAGGRAWARVIAARAALALGRNDDATATARDAVDAAARLDLAWTEAWASWVLASTSFAPGPDGTPWTVRAADARDRFFERVPHTYREAVRGRADWIELSTRLDSELPTGGEGSERSRADVPTTVGGPK